MSEERRMPKPSVWDEMFPGRFLKAGLLKGKDVTLTISAVDLERLPNDKGQDETRGVLSFAQTDRQLTINKTNGLCLKAMFGGQVQGWVGKRVTFFPTMDRFGSESVEAIRVRGSPDIAHDIEVLIKFPKKKPVRMKLLRMTKKGDANPAQPQQPAQPPEQPKPSESDGPP